MFFGVKNFTDEGGTNERTDGQGYLRSRMIQYWKLSDPKLLDKDMNLQIKTFQPNFFLAQLSDIGRKLSKMEKSGYALDVESFLLCLSTIPS